jgi:outer membrane protein assembly factor BamB
VIWYHEVGSTAAPLVGRHGTIYLGYGTRLVAFTPSGKLEWRRKEPDGALGLAERADGTILVVGRSTLTAARSNGSRIWSVRVGRSRGQFQIPSLIVDAVGTSYVGNADGRLRIISKSGKVLTSLAVNGRTHNGVVPDALLGPDGELVVNGADGVLRVYGP